MPNSSHKTDYLHPIRRYFTREGLNAYELIDFDRAQGFDRPSNWSADATETFAQIAAYTAAPTERTAIEENTVPSWLWQRTAAGKPTGRQAEDSAQQVFNRLIGAALYRGWKHKLFRAEAEAQAYCDELRYILAQRMVVIEPALLAKAGLGWAYGVKPSRSQSIPTSAPHSGEVIAIDNQIIDTIVSGQRSPTLHAPWKHALALQAQGIGFQLRFTDTIRQWNAPAADAQPAQALAAIDLLSLRHNNGLLNIDLLKQVTRLTVILLDLQTDAPVTTPALSYFNLAPLLMGLALAYDSDEGRATAAAISAIMTAEAYATSAELAKLRGKSQTFIDTIETVMRSLRNHCRAAYGDQTDYEKTSILPAALDLKACPDLTLVAEAQRSWDQALTDIRANGLRMTNVTALPVSRQLGFTSESATQNIAPLRSLVSLQTEDGESYRRELHPSVLEALKRLGYDRAALQTIASYIIGAQNLADTPVINTKSLRQAGLDDAALARIEDYLPYVNDLRLAITPWIVGETYCRDVLHITADQLAQPGFNLLHHLGFSASDIAAANAFCYGHDSLQGLASVKAKHQSIFALQAELSAEARLRMAAAVQSFISDDVMAQLALPADLPPARMEKIFLEAWRQGLKSLTLSFAGEPASTFATQQNIQATKSAKSDFSFLHTQKPTGLPQRRSHAKAQSNLVSGKAKLHKNIIKTKH